MKLSTAIMNYVSAKRAGRHFGASGINNAIGALEPWQADKLETLIVLVRQKHSISHMKFTDADLTSPVDLTRKCDAWEDLADMVCDEIEE